jgi:hypothetical protein
MEYNPTRFRKAVQAMKMNIFFIFLLLSSMVLVGAEDHISYFPQGSFGRLTESLKGSRVEPSTLLQSEDTHFLNLSNRSLSSWEGIELFGHYFKSISRTITVILLDNNQLQEPRIDLLSSLFPKLQRVSFENNKITKLDISNLFFGSPSLLLKAHENRVINPSGNLSADHHILYISVSKNLVDKQVSDELHRLLQKNKNATYGGKLLLCYGNVALLTDLLIYKYFPHSFIGTGDISLCYLLGILIGTYLDRLKPGETIINTAEGKEFQ